MYLFCFLCRPMIIVSNENASFISDCKPTARPTLGGNARDKAGKAGANSAVPVIPVATSNMVDKLYKETKEFEFFLCSWSLCALGLISFYLISRRSFFPFVWEIRGKRRLIFFPFIPENDLLMSSPGEKDVTDMLNDR